MIPLEKSRENQKWPKPRRRGNLRLYWQALGSSAEQLHQRLGAMCYLDPTWRSLVL